MLKVRQMQHTRHDVLAVCDDTLGEWVQCVRRGERPSGLSWLVLVS